MTEKQSNLLKLVLFGVMAFAGGFLGLAILSIILSALGFLAIL